eukprot:365965-Chlamydomonas_euryale.AAC.11
MLPERLPPRNPIVKTCVHGRCVKGDPNQTVRALHTTYPHMRHRMAAMLEHALTGTRCGLTSNGALRLTHQQTRSCCGFPAATLRTGLPTADAVRCRQLVQRQATLHVAGKGFSNSAPGSHVPVGGMGVVWGDSGRCAVARPLPRPLLDPLRIAALNTRTPFVRPIPVSLTPTLTFVRSQTCRENRGTVPRGSARVPIARWNQ